MWRAALGPSLKCPGHLAATVAVTQDFVIGLGAVLIVAAVAVLIVHRLRQPMVLGYLVAGMLVGPAGPLEWTPFAVAGVEAIATLAIVFILLGIGMEFSPRRLQQLGVTPVITAILQVTFTFLVGRWLATLLGFGAMEALFIGCALAISSTIVAVKVLEERGELHQPVGGAVVGTTLMEDVIGILILALIGGLVVTGAIDLGALPLAALGVAGFAIAAFIIGILIMPRLLNAIGPVSEVLLMVLLAAAFLMAIIADHFGFSVALGAFIVGVVAAESRVVGEAQRLIEPLKHVFTAVFFVAIGMLIVPAELIGSWSIILAFSGILFITRVLGVGVPMFLFGIPPAAALRGGASLIPIGEFSFIILATGTAAGLIGGELLTIFVGVAAITILTAPYATRLSPFVIDAAAKVAPAALRSYAGLYTTWVQQLGAGEEARKHRRREFHLLRRIMLNLLVVAAIATITYLLFISLTGEVVSMGQVTIPLEWAALVILGIIMLPFIVTILNSLREIAMELILELVPDRTIMEADPPLGLKVARASLGLLLALGTAVLVVAVAPGTGLAANLLIIAMILLVLLAAGLFWRQVRTLHTHMEETLEDLFGTVQTSQERDEVMRLIGRHYKVSLETTLVDVPTTSPVAHRQIRDAQLRNRTGATVVSVERDRERWVNPPPSMLILPGDRLLLMGEPAHLERARTYITRHEELPETERATMEKVTVEEHILHPDAVACGRTISGLGLRERTGASIVAILRDGDHIQNPPPNLVLQAEDRVFMIGTKDQVKGAVALLEELHDQKQGPSNQQPSKADTKPDTSSST